MKAQQKHPSLEKTFSPKEVEATWQTFWEHHQFFQADPNSSKPPFSICLPPPNVTGKLHMGHALVCTLSDIIVRYHRMQGFDVLWLPGTDHAGIATQTVVEKELLRTTGKRRVDFTRDAFLQHVFEKKEESQHTIFAQLKKMGCSCDFSKLRFTLDAEASTSVATAFTKLYDQGLIYRGDYLVNWDTATGTALADDEVEYEERQGFLWHFAYPIQDSHEHIVIATTRPETLLGDTAVAVHPEDPRTQHLIGKQVQLPLTNRSIPIIADHRVDPTFGTGALKITPAHDPNDYAIGLDHNLPQINIMTADGKILPEFPPFAGLSMEEARRAVVQKMEEANLLRKKEPHTHNVGVSYRSKAVIEPFLSKQWYVKMEPFKQQLKDAVDSGQVELIPSSWKNLYHHWIDNLRDWCISRQLWWGHRIPIYYKKEDPEQILCTPNPQEVDLDLYTQDPDVLDTWFSSALWPFSTLNWPQDSQLLSRYYPNSLLITGWDILFFWVSRMIFMGQHFLNTPPFHKVYLHGLIYGKSYWRTLEGGHIQYVPFEEKEAFDQGAAIPRDVESKFEKMSKSKGNVLDPMTMIDRYGADAVRMALASSPSSSRQIDLEERKLEEYKNFSNKLWNAARFVLMHIEDLNPQLFMQGLKPQHFAPEDHWILYEWNQALTHTRQHLDSYRFDLASDTLTSFFWDRFCAYYLEICKPTLHKKGGIASSRPEKLKILFLILEHTLRALHPFTPFITEELFQILKKHMPIHTIPESLDPHTLSCAQSLQSPSLTISPFPSPHSFDPPASLEPTLDIIYQIRNIRGEMQLPPKTPIHLSIQTTSPLQSHIIEALIPIESITIAPHITPPAKSVQAQTPHASLFVSPPQEFFAQEEKRQHKAREKLLQEKDKLTRQLDNQNFVEKAPRELVEKLQKALQLCEEKLSVIHRD